MQPLARTHGLRLLALPKSACVALVAVVGHGQHLAARKRWPSQRVAVAGRWHTSTTLPSFRGTPTPSSSALVATPQAMVAIQRLTARRLLPLAGSQGLTEPQAGRLSLALAGAVVLVEPPTKATRVLEDRHCMAVAVAVALVGTVALVALAATTSPTTPPPLAQAAVQGLAVAVAVVAAALEPMIRPHTTRCIFRLVAATVVGLASQALAQAVRVALAACTTAQVARTAAMDHLARMEAGQRVRRLVDTGNLLAIRVGALSI